MKNRLISCDKCALSEKARQFVAQLVSLDLQLIIKFNHVLNKTSNRSSSQIRAVIRDH